MQRDDFRDDKPVTRGQWEAIARMFCELASDIEVPGNRYEATELIARLRKTDIGGRTVAIDDLPF